MAKPNLGEKHACPNCETRFFDLGKQPPTCPKCKTVIETAQSTAQSTAKGKVKTAVKAVEKSAEAKPADADDVVADEIEDLVVALPVDDADDADDLDSDDDDDDLMEDTSDLDDADADISAVVSTGEPADG